MSCNCNTANPKCEPCMICTPPGVTNLPDCNPVDPCEGNQVNGDCVKYAGPSFDCIGAYSGDTIFQVMFAILEYYQPIADGECCDIGDGTVEYAPPLTTTTTSTTTTSTTTTTTIPPACVYYEITNVYEFGASAIEYVPCNSEEYVGLEVSTSQFICVNYEYPVNLIFGDITSETWGPCDTPAPTTSTTTTTTICQCNEYTIQNLSNQYVSLEYTACEDDERTLITFTIGPNKTISVCACGDILSNASAAIIITGPGASCTTTPTTTTTTSTTSTTTTSTTTTSTTTTTTTIAPVCNCYTIENPTEEYLGYEWGDCDKFALEYSSVAPGTTAYRCSLDTYISVSDGLILTNLGLCDENTCNPPLEVTIGTSEGEVCGGGGTPLSVTANSSNFCDATEFYLDPITYPDGLYYIYNGSVYVLVEQIAGVAVVIVPCTACTTTTTSSTTTTTTLLVGRRATIPVPVLPNADLVIDYTDTDGNPVVGQVIPAQASPLDYYLCIQCDTTITVTSGTVPGTIGYSDTSSVECNCI